MLNSLSGARRLDLVRPNSCSGWNVFHRYHIPNGIVFPTKGEHQLRNESLRIILSAIFKQFVNFRFKFISVLLIIQGLLGCGSHVYHFVEPGETLYSISWAYGHDYRQVARWNDISPPYIVKKGQRLRVVPVKQMAKSPKKSFKNNVQASSQTGSKAGKAKADNKVAKRQPSVVSKTTRSGRLVWRWPVKNGKIVQRFDAGNPARQGVDVKGKFGQPVYSAESGRVVYSGSGLKHYGKLIIVKHNETFLSAYAHNKRLLVKEGDVLKAGQRIAEMGSTGTNATKLHFEIRRNGKPVDPLRYLPRR